MNLPNAENLIESLKNKINEVIDDNTVLIGVQRGGELILQKILPGLRNTVATGSIDTSFYRDDFSSRGLKIKNKPSKIDTEINGKHIILIDDVFSSGRTVRAAMNEIFDYGRPDKITLAVLIDRNEQELPIAPQICIEKISLNKDQHLELILDENKKFAFQLKESHV
ncbi:bifunctional pyr operon transcriptional regulator/uracil phosphoribosyltransferase PyrR [Candidatus Methylopumilus universalis]|jgi:pyrimidine operon attenuation protein/uracil phosphoribosyltransferase|uniref:Bifunctional pyr operon transcriptional regulator/uracil phosphoribosyltransferase PyrR n=1 Tax=Candidatus Methylopumilus universalis TaxID=2588536 RepID=A0ABX5VVM8_9PROT|nr:bifunctional pyr operon transcriptional regulator/uracil phosphoribosyltransferase PyrR [Candidatus Methylopumilus universalis]QDC50820.1 bifunctional pyr operon transcriptional regulator/uracil phosphoribosyltransferase PyrR [Candidatus Methylopumilus universalis]QDC60954.1 bifunctional pyr operon transcriptional regulator/uracil phosphoribosyltransferase PyrR [Candidatus Methylopumilus universalis]QDC79964.1 bifunctional pyr operon transcriptional regulator/uracil phosphoribosyltransferase 